VICLAQLQTVRFSILISQQISSSPEPHVASHRGPPAIAPAEIKSDDLADWRLLPVNPDWASRSADPPVAALAAQPTALVLNRHQLDCDRYSRSQFPAPNRDSASECDIDVSVDEILCHPIVNPLKVNIDISQPNKPGVSW
jgi:hypothetical protein